MSALGTRLLKGKGVPRDVATARTLLEKAAKAGQRYAAELLKRFRD